MPLIASVVAISLEKPRHMNIYLTDLRSNHFQFAVSSPTQKILVRKTSSDATTDVAYLNDGSAIRRRIAVTDRTRMLIIAVSHRVYLFMEWVLCLGMRSACIYYYPITLLNELFVCVFHEAVYFISLHRLNYSREENFLPEQWVFVSQWWAVHFRRLGLWSLKRLRRRFRWAVMWW